MNAPRSSALVPAGREPGGFVFLLLASYLFLLFFRPFDLIPSLKVLHLPMVTGGLCLVAYVAHRLTTGESVIPLSPITKVLALISLWAVVTIPFAFWISGSVHAFLNDWAKAVILFLFLANVLQTVKQVRQVVWICVLGATSISVIAIALDVFLGESVSEGRLVTEASGLYSGSNLFSMTLILLLPYAMFVFFLHRKLLVRLFAGFVVASYTVANMMTESRTGVLGEAVVVLLVFWALRNWGVSLVKSLGAVLLGAVLFLPLAPKGMWQRFSTLIGNSDVTKLDPNSAAGSALGSKLQRKELLIRAVILTVENPIFGVGMNNFPSAAHDRFSSGAEDWVGCHNTYLQISSELGIPGLILYLYLLYVTFKSLRQLKERVAAGKTEIPDPTDLRLFADATMISFLGYTLFSVVAHIGYQPYFFIVAGIGEALNNISMRLARPVHEVPVSLPGSAQVSPLPMV